MVFLYVAGYTYAGQRRFLLIIIVNKDIILSMLKVLLLASFIFAKLDIEKSELSC